MYFGTKRKNREKYYNTCSVLSTGVTLYNLTNKMKKRFTYLLPALTINSIRPVVAHQQTKRPCTYLRGTFNGQFRKLHRIKGATKIDTTKANIQLVLESGGTYKVLGDTATLHAGSKGTYAVVGNALAFQDATFSRPILKYIYTGTTPIITMAAAFYRMVLNSADTLAYNTTLKR
jgi:hypothetical protein